MRKLFTLLLLTCFVSANEHFAKVEPFESVTIKAEASGEVLAADKGQEGKVVDGVIVHIDDLLSKKDLNSTLESLELTKKMIAVNSDMVAALKKNVTKKRALFEKVSPLSTASVNQKDSLYGAYVSAKSQYNSVLEKILSLKNQKVTLEQKVHLLKDTIVKKTIVAKSKYLYKLMVQKGEFVTVGMPLVTLQSIDRGKLTLFLSRDELDGIKKKTIYIDGKKSDLKIDKIWSVADAQFISSYRVEIVVPQPKEFSKLVKVEFK
ncbi:MAG TPA: hypothetical protein ENK74_01895 [Nitratifractor sp.]|nr:hypothetical protein [Nitratifractor sp.]